LPVLTQQTTPPPYVILSEAKNLVFLGTLFHKAKCLQNIQVLENFLATVMFRTEFYFHSRNISDLTWTYLLTEQALRIEAEEKRRESVSKAPGRT
jgi:hypothetical protein